MADAQIRGLRIFYQRLGKAGAPLRVVFVHGLIMDNLASWYFTVANELAADADVLLYDIRGHGKSELTRTNFKVDELVLELAELVDTVLGPGPVCVVGNSFGGLLALRYAREHRERVTGLVLVDANPGDKDFGEFIYRTLSLRGAEADALVEIHFANWLGRHSQRKRGRLANQASTLIEGTSLVEDLRVTAPYGPAECAGITARTLAIYGEKSEFIERSRPLIAAIPDAQLEVLPGCSHSVLWEATEEVCSQIVRFCRTLPVESLP